MEIGGEEPDGTERDALIQFSVNMVICLICSLVAIFLLHILVITLRRGWKAVWLHIPANPFVWKDWNTKDQLRAMGWWRVPYAMCVNVDSSKDSI